MWKQLESRLWQLEHEHVWRRQSVSRIRNEVTITLKEVISQTVEKELDLNVLYLDTIHVPDYTYSRNRRTDFFLLRLFIGTD